MTRAIVKGFKKLIIVPRDPASFSRSSPAYNPEDGSQVAVNEPRYVEGPFPGSKALLVEEGTQNIWAYSDPTIAQIPVKGNVTDAGGVGDRFSNGVYFGDNSVVRYAYRADTLSPGTLYTLSCYVLMDDGEAPVVGTTSSSGDFGLVIENNLVTNPASVVAVGDGIYRISGSFTSRDPIANHNSGIAKYAGQSARGFKVSGLQIEAKGYATTLVPTNGTAATRSPETMTIPTAGVLNDRGPWTIECWAKTDHAGGGYRMPFAAWDKFYVALDPSDRPLFSWVNASDAQQWASATNALANPTDWHFWVFTWDGSIARVYVDAVKVIEAATDLPKTLPTNLTVGSIGDKYYWDGPIAGLRISSRARTDAEILAAYQSNAPLPVDEWTTLKVPFNASLAGYGLGYVYVPSNKTRVVGGHRRTKAVLLSRS